MDWIKLLRLMALQLKNIIRKMIITLPRHRRLLDPQFSHPQLRDGEPIIQCLKTDQQLNSMKLINIYIAKHFWHPVLSQSNALVMWMCTTMSLYHSPQLPFYIQSYRRGSSENFNHPLRLRVLVNLGNVILSHHQYMMPCPRIIIICDHLKELETI